jgi:hypothetical protein
MFSMKVTPAEYESYSRWARELEVPGSCVTLLTGDQ